VKDESMLSEDWRLYQKGIDYHNKINLNAEVNKNERFFTDDQWNGVVSNGLPTPVINVIKRIILYKKSSIMSDQIKIQYSIDGLDDVSEDDRSAELRKIADVLTKYADAHWERFKQDSINEQVLLDAAISGDGCVYYWWDDTIKLASDADSKGDMICEIVDGVNYFPGNPNSVDVQKQPYILISFRELVENVTKEAKQNGLSKDEIKKISCDDDTSYEAGDRSQIELDDSGKTTCILKLWKKDGTVWARKSTKHVTYQKDKNTFLTLYPFAMMNWEIRKHSCHGVAEATGIIPNQIYINKSAAMVMISQMHTAYPKLLYDPHMVPPPKNTIGEAIPVSMSGAGDVRKGVAYLYPTGVSNDVFSFLETVIQQTKEMAGANETALGEVKPDNTSAIIALQQASSIPLESVKRRFYQFIEDVAKIWLDFWITKYNRNLVYEEKGVKKTIQFNGQKYKDVMFMAKVDIGPSSRWSQITALQTLDALLEKDRISFLEYLERLPNGLIPQKEELLESRRQMEQQPQDPAVQQFIMTLPPELQPIVSALSPQELAELMALPPEQQQQILMEMSTAA
jgi:hypothetical protein